MEDEKKEKEEEDVEKKEESKVLQYGGNWITPKLPNK